MAPSHLDHPGQTKNGFFKSMFRIRIAFQKENLKKKRATKRNKVMIIHIIIKPRISFPFSRRWEEELCSCRQPRCIHSWLMFHNWEDLNWSNLQYQLFLEFPWTWIVQKWIRKQFSKCYNMRLEHTFLCFMKASK